MSTNTLPYPAEMTGQVARAMPEGSFPGDRPYAGGRITDPGWPATARKERGLRSAVWALIADPEIGDQR